MLFGWMKSLIIYLILSGLVINLAPGGNYKKYISFFTGLIVIIILAEPISYIFKLSGGDIDEFTAGIEEYMEQAEVIEDRDTIYDYYEMSLGEAVKQSVCSEGYKVTAVEIITDEQENVLKCTVVLDSSEQVSGNETEVNIKKCIYDVYNIDFESIYIVRR